MLLSMTSHRFTVPTLKRAPRLQCQGHYEFNRCLPSPMFAFKMFWYQETWLYKNKSSHENYYFCVTIMYPYSKYILGSHAWKWISYASNNLNVYKSVPKYYISEESFHQNTCMLIQFLEKGFTIYISLHKINEILLFTNLQLWIIDCQDHISPSQNNFTFVQKVNE